MQPNNLSTLLDPLQTGDQDVSLKSLSGSSRVKFSKREYEGSVYYELFSAYDDRKKLANWKSLGISKEVYQDNQEKGFYELDFYTAEESATVRITCDSKAEKLMLKSETLRGEEWKSSRRLRGGRGGKASRGRGGRASGGRKKLSRSQLRLIAMRRFGRRSRGGSSKQAYHLLEMVSPCTNTCDVQMLTSEFICTNKVS